mgnify:CR=1 FL=1
MKKILSSLPVRLIIGVVIGIIIGLGSADLWIGGTDVGGTIMQVVLTLKNLLGSLINFCVPLIIIGFIAPSITRLRSTICCAATRVRRSPWWSKPAMCAKSTMWHC